MSAVMGKLLHKQIGVAYLTIAQEWKNKRSSVGVPYMHYIDTGLMILRHNQVDIDTMRAWCIHPLVQDVKGMLEWFDVLANTVSWPALALAVEYRNQITRYSSHKHATPGATVPSLDNVLPQVVAMIKADKVQNYWNLCTAYKDEYRYVVLTPYFKDWMSALNISSTELEYWFNMLDGVDAINCN